MKKFVQLLEDFEVFPKELNQIDWDIVKDNEYYKKLRLLGFYEFHSDKISMYTSSLQNILTFTLDRGNVKDLDGFKFKHLPIRQYLIKLNAKLCGDLTIQTAIDKEDTFDQVDTDLNKQYANIWTTDLMIEAVKLIYNYLPTIIKKLNSWNCKLRTDKVIEIDDIQTDNIISNQINDLW